MGSFMHATSTLFFIKYNCSISKMSDDETDEGYNEFIKEYGSRYEWDNEGNPEFIPEW